MTTTPSPSASEGWPAATTCAWMRTHGFDPDLPARPGRHNDSALILASRRGDLEVVMDLLRHPKRAAVNHRNMDGTNALWAAVVSNSFAIADALLESGIDIDNINDNGASTLMYASSAGKDEWVMYLLARKADTSPVTPEGFSALDLASTEGCLRQIRQHLRNLQASA